MADYYPVLVRAVSSLPDNNARARQDVYEHARTIAETQMLRPDLQRSPAQIMRERAALETAIRRVETESLSAQTRALNGASPRQPAAAVTDDGDDIGIGAKARPAPEKPELVLTNRDKSRIVSDRIFVSTLTGVQVFDSRGQYLKTIDTPPHPANVAVTGPGKLTH